MNTPTRRDYAEPPTPTELADARRLLRSVEETNRVKKRSNAAVRALWTSWDVVADRMLGVAR